MSHPHGVHNDIRGPLLFVGGRADGQRRSINASHDGWIIPAPIPSPGPGYVPYDPSEDDPEPHHYDRRTMVLGSALHRVEVDVMIWNRMDGPAAYAAALEHIAALVNGKDRA